MKIQHKISNKKKPNKIGQMHYTTNMSNTRTKMGDYSCPSLHITENQGQGKDYRHTFCPKLQTHIF